MSVVLWLGKKGIYLVFRVEGIVSFSDGEADSLNRDGETTVEFQERQPALRRFA